MLSDIAQIIRDQRGPSDHAPQAPNEPRAREGTPSSRGSSPATTRRCRGGSRPGRAEPVIAQKRDPDPLSDRRRRRHHDGEGALGPERERAQDRSPPAPGTAQRGRRCRSTQPRRRARPHRAGLPHDAPRSHAGSPVFGHSRRPRWPRRRPFARRGLPAHKTCYPGNIWIKSKPW